jgi:hypothetical protein
LTETAVPIPARVIREYEAEVAEERRAKDVEERKAKALAAKVARAAEFYSAERLTALDEAYTEYLTALETVVSAAAVIYEMRGPLAQAHNVLVETGAVPAPMPPSVASRALADHQVRALVLAARQSTGVAP